MAAICAGAAGCDVLPGAAACYILYSKARKFLSHEVQTTHAFVAYARGAFEPRPGF